MSARRDVVERTVCDRRGCGREVRRRRQDDEYRRARLVLASATFRPDEWPHDAKLTWAEAFREHLGRLDLCSPCVRSVLAHAAGAAERRARRQDQPDPAENPRV